MKEKKEKKENTTLITRKITVIIDEPDKEKRKEMMALLKCIRRAVTWGCNLAVAALFAKWLQRKHPEYFKAEFYGIEGGVAGSDESSVYPLMAEMNKKVGEEYGRKLYTKFFNAEKPLVVKGFNADMKEIDKKGWCRNMRSYKQNSPIHFLFGEMKGFRLAEHEKNSRTYKDLFFSLKCAPELDIPFRSIFGRDASDNKAIVERVISGEYEPATCGLQIPQMGDRLTLLLAVHIPVKNEGLDPKKHALAFIAPDAPMRVVCGIENGKCRDKQIGSGSDYFNNRIRIQTERRSLQRDAAFCRGGHGRRRKLRICDTYGKREGNYMKKQVEKWSKDLLGKVVKEGCGTLFLFGRERFEAVNKAFSENHEYALDDFPLTLRNWSFSGLNTRIKQVAAKYGVNVVEMAEEGDEKNAFANEDKKMTKKIAKWETFLSNLYDSFGYACKNAKKWMRKKRRDEEDNEAEESEKTKAEKPKKTVKVTATDTQLSFDF